MDVNSLKNEFNKIEKKLFEKQNIRFLANIYFRLIDDVVDSTNKSLEKQKMIEKYISELDKIYLDSFVEKKGKEKSLLTLSQIEKYSILKYFMIIKKDFLIDFAADELLKYYSKELEESFEIQDIKIINILTKEKIELTKNRKNYF